MEQNKRRNEKQDNLKAVIPKEIRNLAFNMKFKEGEPRTRGRITRGGGGGASSTKIKSTSEKFAASVGS